MKKTGLYFGSFNPIHIGHLLVATEVAEIANLDEVWFVVSPQNPFKINSELAHENHRLEMVKLAIDKSKKFKTSAIEFNLPKPSYTHATLKELVRQFPQHLFYIIIGEDNAAKFNEWKEADWILNNFEVIVFARNISTNNNHYDSRLKIIETKKFDISSTEIRNRIKNKQTIQYYTTENVEQYIRFHKLYL